MSYFFTSESVSEGHPDKVADQISDAILDHFLAFDSQSKVACETLVTTGQVILAGEVNSKAYVDLQEITRKVIGRIGYNDSQMNFTADSCGVLSAIHEQSPDIRQGVVKTEKESQGAGDQGMMFGYATNETENFMPLALDLSHRILLELAEIRKNGNEMPYLRPDAKAQVTLEYGDDNKPKSIHTIVVSTQHDEFGDDAAMQERIRRDVIQIVIPRVIQKLPTHIKELFNAEITYHINPTGKFVIGGPHGDTGLTGRKIIVDTYGGKGAHGGGAFSGKDPSKVDRSAAYAMRHLAKNLVAAGACDEVLVQVSYAIGVAEPTSLFIDTYGTSKLNLSDAEIAEKLLEKYDFRPYAIEEKFKLRNPIYEETAAYGHMGREPRVVKKVFAGNGREKIECEVELFTWEKLDIVEELKTLFGL
ncbi:methionine adenosyltransferase [Ornithobacterium rhinotracheale]|uniref:S-adenosylmethionine synthase n=1 Tax=Ornithobacterium rhinotracheale TaxID=28251 RepID=A0A3R5UWD4_ORNRH|nr:methionine adenosyltransferase [Ornithobacterium rhinotracheale]QAR31329.1 methionine adenosyltransferase [Ornithobacterium rhinotracheale]